MKKAPDLSIRGVTQSVHKPNAEEQRQFSRMSGDRAALTAIASLGFLAHLLGHTGDELFKTWRTRLVRNGEPGLADEPQDHLSGRFQRSHDPSVSGLRDCCTSD